VTHASVLSVGSAQSLRRLVRLADLVRVGLLFAAAALLAAGDGAVALKAVLMLPATLAARIVAVNPAFDLLFGLALSAELVGTALATHGLIAWGDTASHLVLPLLSGPVVYVGLVRLGALAVPAPSAAPRLFVGVGLVTAAAVLALGAAWELVEWAADSSLGTDYSQGYHDTVVDLAVDGIAATGAGAAVILWLRAAPRNPVLNIVSPYRGRRPRARSRARTEAA
jgi:hypothetical protein